LKQATEINNNNNEMHNKGVAAFIFTVPVYKYKQNIKNEK
jgi:hypothetical protein